MKKRKAEVADPQAKRKHLLLEVLKVDLLNDFMNLILFPDETHEFCFLQKM